MNTSSSSSNGNGLTIFEQTKLWLAEAFPDVVYREADLIVRNENVEVMSIESIHPRRNGMFIEFCDVYHVTREKDQLFQKGKIDLLVCNKLDVIKHELTACSLTTSDAADDLTAG